MGHVLKTPRKLTRKQVSKLRKSMKRNGESEPRVGTCRFFSKGVEICRDGKASYSMVQARAGSSKKRRATAISQYI